VKPNDRHPDVVQPWLERQTVDVSTLHALPLFQGLSSTELQLIVHSAYRDQVAADDTIVRQWEVSSEFYLIMDGTADVYKGERRIDQLGPGSFFGELAAMDWGASFGYPRLASVIATSPMELLVLPGASFRTIMRDAPAFGDRIRQAVRERMPRL
jgi:CRP-like cAMP-binding protein